MVYVDDNQAVRRLAVVCLKNGSAQRETITLLAALRQDDRLDRDLRDVAGKVAATLKKKAGPDNGGNGRFPRGPLDSERS